MFPYFPSFPLFVPDYCDLRHLKKTVHRIIFHNYIYKRHRVKFEIVCCECEEEHRSKGSIVIMRVAEWKKFIESYTWDGLAADTN